MEGQTAQPRIIKYPVRVSWSEGRSGQGIVQAVRQSEAAPTAAQAQVSDADVSWQLPLAVPSDLGGTGNGTNPEELLAASAAACYGITLGIILENRRIPMTSLTVDAELLLEQAGVSVKVTSIHLRPVLVLPVDQQVQKETIERAVVQAEKACLVSKTMTGNVEYQLEPQIRFE